MYVELGKHANCVLSISYDASTIVRFIQWLFLFLPILSVVAYNDHLFVKLIL